MPKQKSRGSVRDQEKTKKEYERLPPQTVSQKQPLVPFPTTSPSDEKQSSKRKWGRKPDESAKKKLKSPHTERVVVYQSKEVRIEKLQKDVDEVIDLVRTNVDGILERDAKVEDLEIAADRLHGAALEFKKTGKVVMVRYWWRNNRCFVIFGILILIAILVGLAVWIPKMIRSHDSTAAADPPVANVTSEPFVNVSVSSTPDAGLPSTETWERSRTRFPPGRRDGG
ncbi:uncharacterized protein LOC121430136 [Lytechinus variegatus]|uniref:uncharacterized protein LOC121430136 n=1 Tax=Lytechinus variegatus TaxID=7654 RepID=UPI001BB13C4E|nr:uncharacterized protein LOC121430136 [Lytechinus variegatus]